ncbi:hypothetical protein ABZ399_28390 [Micromonospora aurantiaca]|uniref:hypothetical protein n=1 Tax=Micromonospora aurantiaca (nom. illeg.) TaxID=47850 RepID=UPI0033FEFCBC
MTTTLPAHAGPIHLLLNPSIHTVLNRLHIRTNQRVLDVGATDETTTLLARLVGRYGTVTDMPTPRTPTAAVTRLQ